MMKHLNAKKFLVGLLIGGVIIGLYFIYILSQDKTPSEPQQKENEVQEPVLNAPPIEKQEIQSQFDFQGNKYSITFSIPKNSYNILSKIPVYKIENRVLSDEQANTIARNLGFTSNPIKAKDAVYGMNYTYIKGSDFVTILPESRSIEFKAGIGFDDIATFTKTPSPNEMEEIARNYITSHKLSTSQDQIKLQAVEFVYLDPGGHITPRSQGNNTARVTFIKELSGIPLTGEFYTKGSIEILINANKNITSLYMIETPNLAITEEYSTKTYDEVRKTIGQAKLQSLDNGKLPLEDFLAYNLQIRSVSVHKASLAYVLDISKNQELLQPTIILEGTAALSNFTSVPAVLYLPAISEAYFEE
jgi:hypothetical protein